MQAAPPAPSDRLHGSASRVRGPHFLHLQDRRNRSGRLDRNSASQVATTDFPTRPLPFSTRWTSTDEPFPLLELSFGIRVPLLTKEWQGWKSDSQINFFFCRVSIAHGVTNAVSWFAQGLHGSSQRIF